MGSVSRLKNIKLGAFLPGIFLLGFNIGTGSVTAMAKAGATYGMSLLWTIFLSCLVTYFLITIYGRFALITNETALYAFRRHLHPGVGVFFIIALSLTVSGSVMGVMGIVADVCREWIRITFQVEVSPVLIAAFFVVLVYVLFLQGTTRFFQRALAVIVAIMAGSFIVSFFILMPPPLDMIRGMVPHIPKARDSLAPESGALLVIASMVGTTVFSGLFILRTTQVKEAGWTQKDSGIQRRDALASAGMMFVISLAVMAAAAGTLYERGTGLTDAAQMIQLLEPLAGRFAMTIFVFGIVAAGVSSQFPNVLLLPWLLCDYFNLERDMTRPRYRLIVALISVLGLVVPIFNARPVAVMIASQAFGALILPVTVISIMILGNRRVVVGDKTYSLLENAILLLIAVFALYMSATGLIALWRTFLQS